MTSNPSSESPYYDRAAIAAGVAAGDHRGIVGGMWDEIGQLQFDFVFASGLLPHHSLLDIGCGSFRGGVYFVRYLEAGHYFGLDINPSLIDAGYTKELMPLGLDKKLPRSNLISNEGFDLSAFDRRFDFALALSLFTHLSLNSIRTCLEQLRNVIAPDGRLLATVFESPADVPLRLPQTHATGGIVTFGDRDPYHYRRSDLAYIAESAGWATNWIGNFAHPRDQRMVEFRPRDGAP